MKVAARIGAGATRPATADLTGRHRKKAEARHGKGREGLVSTRASAAENFGVHVMTNTGTALADEVDGGLGAGRGGR